MLGSASVPHVWSHHLQARHGWAWQVSHVLQKKKKKKKKKQQQQRFADVTQSALSLPYIIGVLNESAL